MAMICIEWWSFEIGAFLTGTVYTTQYYFVDQCMQFVTRLVVP